jgi:hypothetical protein
MAAWSIIWTYVPDCGSLCGTMEAVKQLDHHLLAAAIYSGIITVVTATVVRKEYFDKLFYKLRAHGINTNGAKNVWRFTLAIFLFNATLHVVEVLLTDTDQNFLAYAPWTKLSWLTVFRMVYSLGNVGLWLAAAMLHKRDTAAEFIVMSMQAESYSGADKDALFKKRKALLAAYFTPAILLFAFDDTLSKNWEVFNATGRLRSLLTLFQTLHGWLVPTTLIVLALMAVAMIVVAMFYQEKVRDFGWKMLVYAVPHAAPIVSMLIVGTLAVAFFALSGGGTDGNISNDSPSTYTATAPQSSPPMAGAPQSSAPVQPDTQTQTATAPQSSPPMAGAPQSSAPVQPDTQTQTATAPQSSPPMAGAPQSSAPMQPDTQTQTATAPQSSPLVAGGPQSPTPVPNTTSSQTETAARGSPPVLGATPAPFAPPRQRSTSPSKVALGVNPLSAGGGSSGYNQTLRPQ